MFETLFSFIAALLSLIGAGSLTVNN